MSASLSPSPRLRFFGNDGAPLAGGSLITYDNETSQPVATYNDAGMTAENPAQLPLDANGEPSYEGNPRNVFLENGKFYKFKWFDKEGNLVGSCDNIVASGSGGGSGNAIVRGAENEGVRVSSMIDSSGNTVYLVALTEGVLNVLSSIVQGDKLWAHWENENNWHDISSGGTFPNSDYVKSEGELTDSQYPYLKAGLYRFTMEVALRNYPSVYDAIEKCDISVNYGSQSLREQSFLFDRTIPVGEGLAETVWFGGIFRMPAEGEVSVSVSRPFVYTTASMKCSHIFINKLGD